MTEIILNGVHIPIEGQKITREQESTLFKREAEVSDFTYPFEIPLTDEVLVAMGYPHELAIAQMPQSYPVLLTQDGVVNLQVTLKILKVSLKKKVAQASIIGDYGSLALVFAEKKLTDLTLGGVRTIGAADPGAGTGFSGFPGTPGLTIMSYVPCNTHLHIEGVIKGTIAADYQFAPGYDLGMQEEEIKPDRGKDYSTTGILLNAWHGKVGTPGGVPDPVRDFIVAMRNTDEYYSPRKMWVPYFKLLYVFRKCWEEAGFIVSGDFFTDLEMMNVLLYNTYSINRCRIENLGSGFYNIYHEAFTIDPRNHMPDMGVMEFLLETAKAFNLEFIVDLGSKTVSVVYVKVGNGDMPIVDISHLAEPDPDISNEEADFRKGYEFSFEWDGADRASGDNGEVNSGGIQKLQSFTADMMGYKTATGDGLAKISTKLVPMENGLAVFVSEFSGGQLYNFPSFSDIGVCGDNLLGWDSDARTFTLTSIPRIAMQPHMIKYHYFAAYSVELPFIGFVNVNAPTATSSARHPQFGNYMGGRSLVWHGAYNEGLYDVHWKRLSTVLQNAPQMEYSVLMDANTYGRYDFRRCIIKINGLHYLLKKSSVVMPFPNKTLMTLVRI